MLIGTSEFSYAETSVDVDEKTKIGLIGQGSDPDNDALTYQWNQSWFFHLHQQKFLHKKIQKSQSTLPKLQIMLTKGKFSI